MATKKAPKSSAKSGATNSATTTKPKTTKSKGKTTKSSKATKSSKTTSTQSAQSSAGAKTMAQNQPLENIANGFGFLVAWKRESFGYMTPSQLSDLTAQFPLQSFVEFEPHTVSQAITLACQDRSFGKIKMNDTKVEAKLVKFDELQDLYTVEFLAYEKVSDKKGKRQQVDTVSLDSQGNVMDSGNTDLAKTWLTAFEKHYLNWNGNDIYAQIISPYLKCMKAFSVATANYYVGNNQHNIDRLEELRNYLGAIGYRLMTLTQAKDMQTQEALKDQFEGILSDRLSDVGAKIDEWRYKARIHGKSEKAVLTELGNILTDANDLEQSLEVQLTTLKDKLTKMREEAQLMLDSQAPSGINAIVYEQLKSMLVPENMQEVEGLGKSYLFHEKGIEDMIVGQKLRADVSKALNHMGYYGFVFAGASQPIIVIKELSSIGDIAV